jgi:hypothetical protein
LNGGELCGETSKDAFLQREEASTRSWATGGGKLD